MTERKHSRTEEGAVRTYVVQLHDYWTKDGRNVQHGHLVQLFLLSNSATKHKITTSFQLSPKQAV